MAPDFGLGKVYVIRNTENANLYVGSTVRTLAQRMAQHRKIALQNDERPLYLSMRELGVNKFYIELLKDFPCERKEQLNAEEGQHIRALNSQVPNGFNTYVAGRTRKEYRADNKAALAVVHRDYHAANKESLAVYKKEYRNANKEDILARDREYHRANKEAIAARAGVYRDANKEALKAKRHAYYLAHAAEINAKRRELTAAKNAAAQAPVTPAEPVAN